MDFNQGYPDPERVEECIENLKSAFNKAAAADSGRAKPLFETLSQQFETALDEAKTRKQRGATSPLSPSELMPALVGIQATTRRIAIEAQTNPKAFQVLKELEEDVKQEIQKLAAPKQSANQNKTTSTEKTQIAKKTIGKGKMPNKGSFDL